MRNGLFNAGGSILLLTLVGCQNQSPTRQTKNDQAQNGEMTASQSIVQSQAIQEFFIADQNQELTEHLADDGNFLADIARSAADIDSASMGLKLSLTPAIHSNHSGQGPGGAGHSVDQKTVEKKKVCTEDATSNKVTISRVKSFSGGVVSKKTEKSRASSETSSQVWEHPSVDLTCVKNSLNLQAIAGNERGLSKSVSYTRSMTLNISKGNTKKMRDVSKQGTRTIEYLSNVQTNTVDNTKTISLKINATTAKSHAKNSDGIEKTTKSTAKTTDLMVDIKRKDSSWIEKLVKSGSIVSETENGNKLTYNIDNLLFQKSDSTDSCEPISGNISGTLESGGASSTFKISYVSGQVTVTVNDQPGSLEVDFGGCDFGNVLDK